MVAVDDASLALSFFASAVVEVAAPPKLNPPDDDAFESLEASVAVVAFAPPPKENEGAAGLSVPFEAVSPPPKLIPAEPLFSVAAGAGVDPNENPVDAESFLSSPPEAAGAGAPPPNENPPAAELCNRNKSVRQNS